MWGTIVVFVLLFVVLSFCLWFFIRQSVRRRQDVITANHFDFDAFKSRELARRGLHDSTRLGK